VLFRSPFSGLGCFCPPWRFAGRVRKALSGIARSGLGPVASVAGVASDSRVGGGDAGGLDVTAGCGLTPATHPAAVASTDTDNVDTASMVARRLNTRPPASVRGSLMACRSFVVGPVVLAPWSPR